MGNDIASRVIMRCNICFYTLFYEDLFFRFKYLKAKDVSGRLSFIFDEKVIWVEDNLIEITNNYKGAYSIVGTAIYPGSFDPVTKGHLDIIERTSRIMDYLIVVVMENPRKQAVFTIEERVDMLRSVIGEYKNVQVEYYQGLLIDYARQKDVKIIVKGLRAISDFEFEFQMALINRKLNPNFETLFMMTNSKYSYLSSSIVKEIASFGGEIRDLVPDQVYKTIMNKYR